MSQNMRLGDASLQNRTITSENSDVTASFTLPSSKQSGFNVNNNSSVYVHPTQGGYYSWFAATAGTGTTSLSTQNATSSICPKGWHLPVLGEYTTLMNKYGGPGNASSVALRAEPASFTPYGHVNNGSFDSCVGRLGLYWTATSQDSTSAQTFWIWTDNSGTLTTTYDKQYGFQVRCISD